MSVRITERRTGNLDSLRKNLRGAAVTVGLHEKEGAATKKVWGEKTLKSGEVKPARVASDGNESLVEVMAAHEFGQGTPQRSWLSAWFDEDEDWLKKQMEEAAKRAVRDGRPVSIALMQLGKRALARMKARIRSGIAPALSDRRKREKLRAGVGAKDTPLIFTSQFINSLTAKDE
jgi:hypothetical protein